MPTAYTAFMSGATVPAQLLTPNLHHLTDALRSADGFARAARRLNSGKPASFTGVWGSARSLLAASLVGKKRPLVVLLPTVVACDDFLDVWETFTTLEAVRFPAWESERRLLEDDIYGERLRLLKRLAQKEAPAVIAAPIAALLQRAPTPESITDNTRLLSVGATIDLDELLKWLAQRGFHNTSAVELPGEFAWRGGILDVFPPDGPAPVRIEFFDNEIESIRHFNVTNQRSIGKLNDVELTVLTSQDSESASLIDYLGPDSRFLLLEPEEIQKEAAQFLSRVTEPAHYHTLEPILQRAHQHGAALASGLLASPDQYTCDVQIESVSRFSGEIAKVRTELDSLDPKAQVFLVGGTEAEVERLHEITAETELAGSGRLRFLVGVLKEGFRLIGPNIVAVSAGQMFGRVDLRRPIRRLPGKAIDSFLDLREGNLVVHLGHGIGRYRGLQLIEKEDQLQEHLVIEFRHGAKLFVPASKIDLVQKYIGGTRTKPMLATIGGKSWGKQKSAAQSAVTDMAADLLKVQAERDGRIGTAFGPDTQWQHEFDASFPYPETPDQLVAIDAIKTNMQTPRPMDRLLCGDVGFGKTEVAMRAAFKAVENGYQVAVLVPTTVLAEQHYQTFRQRMAEFPFDIVRLSRFCSTDELRESRERLKSGAADIAIGTHRIASRQMKFFNLGLVIIDEEQRFGVEVKERLKTFNPTVDVLTMSATPIPRTLHMSLVGARDISNLETAPEDRVPVETKVTRFSDELIRGSLLRELRRGGQAYFVHNRVEDIEAVARKVQAVVPEAKIGIGHGQMHERELERVMLAFINHEFDVLIATTIVESGLDIPNANTIFIDEADRYGLADLHQLRGRVGRYKHRAYCYLLVDQHKHLSPNAARRLRAIEEYSEMGAGFAIAMRDLEIRGAGNLLGSQQSGHIAAVGYELYCQLLARAVRQMKNEPTPPSSDQVDVDLPVHAYLPDEYLDDKRLKIDIYRRLTRIADFGQLDEFREELNDRFGSPPAAVERMLSLAELRLQAAIWQVTSIHWEEKRFIAFTFTSLPRIKQLAKLRGGALRIVDDETAYVTLKKGISDPDHLLAAALSVLQAS